MNVLGIDPSLTGTGVAHAEGLLTITSKPDDTLTGRRNRLGGIVHQLDDVVLGVKPWRFERTPDLVVIEAPSLAQHSQAGTLDRNGLWWLIVDRLLILGIPTVEVAPSTLKKFATGKGNATKADMRMALFQRAGLDVRDDNQVDAWWLRQVGLHLLDDMDAITLPKTHADALAKVARP
ncbi:MAG: hypothetical protein KBF43_16340 [Dermatophilaceae bacterium]|nr:hypothetical protein [Dermatophilaceae bacterium]